MSCYEPINTLDSVPLQALGPKQRRFVEALRSGKYKQGQYLLKQDNHTFCALGLAAEMLGVQWARGADGKKWFLSDSNGTCLKAALHWEYSNLYAMKALGQRLSSMNDSGCTFAFIANAIEATPAKFFTEPR